MNKEEAIEFLRRHQPMPPDSELTEDLITRYNEIREYCIAHPDPEYIPLFLNSFGEGDGCGVYVLVDRVMRQFSAEEVIPHLIEALHSEHPSVREWCADIAIDFKSPELIDPLRELLQNPNEKKGTRCYAASDLGLIDDERATAVLEDAFAKETDPEVWVEINDALAGKQSAGSS